MTKEFPKVTLLMMVALILGGCYFKSPKYPTTWPTHSEAADIENGIEGTYECKGETVESQTGMWTLRSLTSFTLGGRDTVMCDHVEIELKNSSELQLRYISAGSETLRQILKKDKDYKLEDGWIVFNQKGWTGAEGIVAAHASATTYLTVNTTNDLIAKVKNLTIGLIIVIPAGTAGTDWGRFKRSKYKKVKDLFLAGSSLKCNA